MGLGGRWEGDKEEKDGGGVLCTVHLQCTSQQKQIKKIQLIRNTNQNK